MPRDDLKRAATASFGARDVPAEEKEKLVHAVFAQVAGRYDLMNDLMSGGLHRAWKHALVDWLNPPRTARPFPVLDVAGGTGDVAFRIAARGGTGTDVVVADINEAMLGVGVRRAAERDLLPRVRFAAANAERLPFEDARFAAYTIAFGIRNVTDIEAALAEARRVLKPGGRFLCLEFSRVEVPLLDGLYDRYSDRAIPALGRLVTGDGDPYRYLVESIRRFPDRDRFGAMMAGAGLARPSVRVLSGGIVALYSGWRI